MEGKQTVLKVCPLANSFVDVKTNVKCPISDCGKTVYSAGSLRMHLTRSHGISETENDAAFHTRVKVKDNVRREYHCPCEDCVYNIRSERHFSSMGQLKQHYMKVHAEKKYKCKNCSSGFGLERDLRRHEEGCGIKFICGTCQCTYISRESLLTHCQRKQHPVPDKYASKTALKKKEKEKNTVLSKCLPIHGNDLGIPVILVPVPINNGKPVHVSSQEFTAAVKSLGEQMLLPRGQKKCNKDMLHMIDHDYQTNCRKNPVLLQKQCGTSDNSVSNSTNDKETQPDNNLQSSFNSSISDMGTQTKDTAIYIAEKIEQSHMDSSIQTMLTLPVKKGRKTVKETQTIGRKTAAQTQTFGDHILKQAMASANIPIEYTSIGIQTSKDKNKLVDMQTQVTPKGKGRKRNSPDKSVQKERGKKKLNLQSSDSQILQDSKKGRRNKKNLANQKTSVILSEVGQTMLDQQNSYDHQITSHYTGRAVNCDQFTRSHEDKDNFSQEMSSSYTDLAQPIGQGTIATSVDEFDFVNTIGVQTYSTGFEDFLLSGNDTSNSLEFGRILNDNSTSFTSTMNTASVAYSGTVKSNSTSTIGINTSLQEKSKSLENKCVGNVPATSADSIVQTVDFDFLASSPDPQSDTMNTQTQTYNFEKSKLLENKCVGHDPPTSANSIVQTVHFDFLSPSPEPQSEVINTQTQTVDFDIESLESIVSSIQTQTAKDYNASFNVHTQTKDYNSSVNTQTSIPDTMDFSSFLSSSCQTQTYDDFPHLIELLSSGTQTLLQDEPLPLINMETQTARSTEFQTASSNKTQRSNSMETQTASSTGKEIANSMQTQTATSMESQIPISIETQTATSMESQIPISIETQTANTMETQVDISMETQTANSTETEAAYSKLNFGTQTFFSDKSNSIRTMESTISSSSYSRHKGINSQQGEENDSIGNSKGEQFEFSVSEVLEMIPVETQTIEQKFYASKVVPDKGLYNTYHIAGGYKGGNKSSEKKLCELSQIKNNSMDGYGFKEVQTCDSSTLTNHQSSDDNQTQTIQFNSGIDCHTQTHQASNNNQTHPGQDSQTQTMLKDIDLTDSHTQTTWKELNDLLAELNN